MEKIQNPYEIVLADLKAKRKEIDQTIEYIEKHMLEVGLSNNSFSSQINISASIESDTFFGMNIAEATKKLLEIKKKKMNTQEIVELLKEGGVHFSTETPVNTVFAVLSRHQKNGEIVKVSRGYWGLSKWYPNASRLKNNNSKKSSGHDTNPNSDENTDLSDLI